MTEVIFPRDSLPGLGWPVTKSPRFRSRSQNAVSGRKIVLLDQPFPIWAFTLPLDFLRDKWDARGTGMGQDVHNELRTLMNFFLRMQGGFSTFLFEDPTDNSVTGQGLAGGDGATTQFQLYRQLAPNLFGSFVEPITAPKSVNAVYVDGAPQGGYSVNYDTGIVTLASPPPLAAAVSADFTYYFRCRLTDDSLDFENIMLGLWQAKQLRFESVLP